MKKSFKKAGAAVLSMAMLLAMGSVSMPVYAAPDDTGNAHQDPQGQPWPGQVEISLDNGAWADTSDPVRNFSYLTGIKDATIRIYKVAELHGDGWKWDEPFKAALLNSNGTVVTGGGPTLANMETLLATDANGNFTATSEQLKELASALERLVMDNNGGFNGTTYVSEGKLNSTTDKTKVYLPHDNQITSV